MTQYRQLIVNDLSGERHWRVVHRQLICSYQGHTSYVWSLAFSDPPGIVPGYQGRGYATEAAAALVAFAFGSGRVRLVRAHTRPAPNASTRVLAKCGFARIGDVVDPEDGLVWRWERTKELA